MSKRQFLIILIPFLALIIIGLLLYPRHDVADDSTTQTGTVETVSLAMLGNDPVLVEAELVRLASFINRFLVTENVQVQPVVAASMDMVEEGLRQGTIDFYLDSPFPVYTLIRVGLVQAVARQWRDGVPEYNSILLTRRDSEIRSIEDLLGRHVAFADPASSSSYFLPAVELSRAGYLLRESGSTPVENDGPFVFTSFSDWDQNSHDWLLQGKVDVAAVSSVFYDQLELEDKSRIRVIHESEKIPRHILAARNGINSRVEDVVVGILMDLETSPDGRRTLNGFYNTRRFDLIPYEQDLRERMFTKMNLLPWEE